MFTSLPSFTVKCPGCLGLKSQLPAEKIYSSGSCVYVANHQSNYDIFPYRCCTSRGRKHRKKSILYFLSFGLIYWLSGNIFIERGNKVKAMQALQKTKEKMLRDNISVWLFPEGTRNYGKGLKPFKTGAFHLARNAGLSLIPVSVSNYYGSFNLNRINNGKISSSGFYRGAKETIATQPVREVVAAVYEEMSTEIAALDKELSMSSEHILKQEDY
jgi:1-acyl-sn-glycerol-3-phosphate acyltransferase